MKELTPSCVQKHAHSNFNISYLYLRSFFTYKIPEVTNRSWVKNYSFGIIETFLTEDRLPVDYFLIKFFASSIDFF